jgi:hypothetical protein
MANWFSNRLGIEGDLDLIKQLYETRFKLIPPSEDQLENVFEFIEVPRQDRDRAPTFGFHVVTDSDTSGLYSLRVNFQTKSIPAFHYVEGLAALYPSLNFDYAYADCHGDVGGFTKFGAGTIIDQFHSLEEEKAEDPNTAEEIEAGRTQTREPKPALSTCRACGRQTLSHCRPSRLPIAG